MRRKGPLYPRSGISCRYTAGEPLCVGDAALAGRERRAGPGLCVLRARGRARARRRLDRARRTGATRRRITPAERPVRSITMLATPFFLVDDMAESIGHWRD